MLLFVFLCLVARQIIHIIFLLRFVLSLIPILIFALFFYLKAYLRCTEPFRMKPDGSYVTSLFWVTIGGTGLSVLKAFLLGYRNFFVLLKCICHWALSGGTAASVALAAGVSLVTILQAGDWAKVSMPARHYFPPTLLL